MDKESIEFNFVSKDKFKDENITKFIVQNPYDCINFKHIEGKKVLVDGELFTVDEVICQRSTTPHIKGEPIIIKVS